MFDYGKIWQPNIGYLENQLTDRFRFDKICLDAPLGCFDYPRKYYDLHDGVDITIHKNYIEHTFCFYDFFPHKRKANISYSEIQTVINILADKYCIDHSQSQLINLEVGLNFKNIPATSTLENTITFRSKQKSNDTYQGKGDGIKFRCAQYDIKMYDQAKRLKIKDQNLLRIEMKYLKSEILAKKNAENLTALLTFPTIKKLFDSYSNVIKNLVIIDPSVSARLSTKDILFIKDCQNPINWKNGHLFGEKKTRYNTRRKIESLHNNSNINILNNLILSEARSEFDRFLN